jgi:hypothetical protein
MSNISSVTELYNKMMQYVPIEYHYLVKEEIPLEQYELIHKEEITKAITFGQNNHTVMISHDLIIATEYYNKTYGGNK